MTTAELNNMRSIQFISDYYFSRCWKLVGLLNFEYKPLILTGKINIQKNKNLQVKVSFGTSLMPTALNHTIPNIQSENRNKTKQAIL